MDQRLLPAILQSADASQLASAWSAGRARVLALDAQLSNLVTVAPDTERAEAAERLRAAVAQVTVSLDAQVAAAPSERGAARVEVELAREQLTARLTGEPGLR